MRISSSKIKGAFNSPNYNNANRIVTKTQQRKFSLTPLKKESLSSSKENVVASDAIHSMISKDYKPNSFFTRYPGNDSLVSTSNLSAFFPDESKISIAKKEVNEEVETEEVVHSGFASSVSSEKELLSSQDVISTIENASFSNLEEVTSIKDVEVKQRGEIIPDIVEIVDFEGKIHTVVNITGIIKKEAENPTATLNIHKEIGRGSERQVFIGDFSYQTANGVVSKRVAITMQDIGMKKSLPWNPLKIITMFKAPKKEINQALLAEAQREYEQIQKIGINEHLDSERLMGVGALLDGKIINVTNLAVGDMLALPPEKVNFPLILYLLKQGGEGIAYLHSKNVCHNDVKPENFLLYEKDGEYLVKLSDLGHLREEGSLADKPLGTPSFAPMERFAVITKGYDQRAFAQTCLDFLVMNLVDFKNVEQKTLFVEVTSYLAKISEGEETAEVEEIVHKLDEFAQRAQELNFKELGAKVNYKGMIKAEEEKRL